MLQYHVRRRRYGPGSALKIQAAWRGTHARSMTRARRRLLARQRKWLAATLVPARSVAQGVTGLGPAEEDPGEDVDAEVPPGLEERVALSSLPLAQPPSPLAPPEAAGTVAESQLHQQRLPSPRQLNVDEDPERADAKVCSPGQPLPSPSLVARAQRPPRPLPSPRNPERYEEPYRVLEGSRSADAPIATGAEQRLTGQISMPVLQMPLHKLRGQCLDDLFLSSPREAVAGAALPQPHRCASR